MPIGLIAAAALIGQSSAATYGPAAPVQPKPAAPVKPAAAECPPPIPDPRTGEIVVCAVKPQGYRIDPDVLAAKKAKKEALAGRPKPPENLKDHSCTVVGPAPCMDAPMINLPGAVLTAVQMGQRLAKGQEIGSMFVTDPQPTEYQLYLEAKKAREDKEADAAAKAVAAQAKAASSQSSSAPTK
jgi:hypothetical protein